MGGHKERVRPYTPSKKDVPVVQDSRKLSKRVRDQLVYLGTRSLADAKPFMEGAPTVPSTS